MRQRARWLLGAALLGAMGCGDGGTAPPDDTDGARLASQFERLADSVGGADASRARSTLPARSPAFDWSGGTAAGDGAPGASVPERTAGTVLSPVAAATPAPSAATVALPAAAPAPLSENESRAAERRNEVLDLVLPPPHAAASIPSTTTAVAGANNRRCLPMAASSRVVGGLDGGRRGSGSRSKGNLATAGESGGGRESNPPGWDRQPHPL